MTDPERRYKSHGQACIKLKEQPQLGKFKLVHGASQVLPFPECPPKHCSNLHTDFRNVRR